MTALFENWNRYYFPDIGRYLSPDPMLQVAAYAKGMAEQGTGTPTYAYARNSPVGLTDPTGEAPWYTPPSPAMCVGEGMRKALDTMIWYRPVTADELQCVYQCEVDTNCKIPLGTATNPYAAIKVAQWLRDAVKQLVNPPPGSTAGLPPFPSLPSGEGWQCAKKSYPNPEFLACVTPGELDVCQTCCLGMGPE